MQVLPIQKSDSRPSSLPEDAAARFLRQWLADPSAREVIYRFVKRRIQYMQVEQGRFLSWLAGSGSADPAVEDVAQLFSLFVLENILPHLHKHPALVQAVFHNHNSLVLEYCWTRLLWRERDRYRQKDRNPRGYLYRRLREVVQRDSRFATFSSNSPAKGLRYQDSRAAGAGLEPFPLAGEQFSDWPPLPLSSKTSAEDALGNAKALAEIAFFFLAEAERRWQRQGAAELRDLVRYIATQCNWLNAPRYECHDYPESATEGVCSISPDDLLDRSRHLDWATVFGHQFGQTLDFVECCILLYRIRETPLPYQQIARRLGLGNFHKARRCFKDVEHRLQRFIRALPGFHDEEFPREVKETFLESLKKNCKNRHCCP